MPAIVSATDGGKRAVATMMFLASAFDDLKVEAYHATLLPMGGGASMFERAAAKVVAQVRVQPTAQWAEGDEGKLLRAADWIIQGNLGKAVEEVDAIEDSRAAGVTKRCAPLLAVLHSSSSSQHHRCFCPSRHVQECPADDYVGVVSLCVAVLHDQVAGGCEGAASCRTGPVCAGCAVRDALGILRRKVVTQ